MARLWSLRHQCVTSEIKKSFHASTIVINVTIKMKIVGTQLLNKLRGNTGRHHSTRKPKRKTWPSVNEWSNQDARKFIAGLRLLLYAGKQSCMCTRNLFWFCFSCSQSKEHDRVHSINSSNVINCQELYACLIRKWIRFIFSGKYFSVIFNNCLSSS
jgi:hypothetical protein